MTNSAVEMMPNKEEAEQFDFLHLPDPSITLSLPIPTQSFLKAAISLKEQVTRYLTPPSLSFSILLKMYKVGLFWILDLMGVFTV